MVSSHLISNELWQRNWIITRAAIQLRFSNKTVPVGNILSCGPCNNAQNNTPKIDLGTHKQGSGERTGQEGKKNDLAMED